MNFCCRRSSPWDSAIRRASSSNSLRAIGFSILVLPSFSGERLARSGAGFLPARLGDLVAGDAVFAVLLTAVVFLTTLATRERAGLAGPETSMSEDAASSALGGLLGGPCRAICVTPWCNQYVGTAVAGSSALVAVIKKPACAGSSISGVGTGMPPPLPAIRTRPWLGAAEGHVSPLSYSYPCRRCFSMPRLRTSAKVYNPRPPRRSTAGKPIGWANPVTP